MPAYRTLHASIAIAGVADLRIRSLLDRQQFHDPQGQAERLGISSAAWPLFGMPWPSGLQLAARLAQRPVRAGERILEVGCGLALASLVGHRRGADVTASDCHPLASSFLRANLRLNRLPPLNYRHGHWGREAAARSSSSSSSIVRDRYDLIIGSDLLYERDPTGGLARFIGRHGSASAEVWIVDPDRGNRAAFTRHMAAQGFGCGEERIDVAAPAVVSAYKGRLLTYRRGGPA
ncbi:MAG TPA: SAM-dependent methyltransferase [Methylibium sp.]|nr:SAM-dependent methyltransferase [Methylibium sp.]